MIVISLNMKEDMLRHLDSLSERTGVTRSLLIRLAVAELLRKARAGESIPLSSLALEDL